MYKFVVVSVIALVILQGVSARPKQEAATAEKSQIDELAGQARQVVKNISQAIDGNLPDSKKVSQTLTDSAQTLATNINSAVNKLSQQASEHKGDVENVVNTIKENLKQTADKLTAAIGPEATQKAKDLKKTLDDGATKAIAEAERLLKAAEPEIGKAQTDLTDAAKSLLNNIVEGAKSLKEKLEKNVKPEN